MMKANLSAYEARRDFQKTAEPRGTEAIKPSEKLRFVVQRHDATRLHYDLRLELDGVFKSWAVTRGPSLNPADKRLAVEVEDHPLGYGDFEGTIPKGQYGGGTVQLFDRGTWAPEGETSAEDSLARGELKFVLDGTRLKGSFVLVRLKTDRRRGTRTNWLLIKHRDAEARDEDGGGGVLGIDSSVASGRTLAEIAAGTGRAPRPFMLGKGRAPRADAVWNSSKGTAADNRKAASKADVVGRSPREALEQPATAGRQRRAAMPDFLEPQLCSTAAKPPSGKGWLHEIKFDGYRLQLRIEAGNARLRTRTGLDWTPRFPDIAAAARRLPDAIIDGECVAVERDGRPDFTALQAALAAERTDRLAFFAFDLLFLEGEDWCRRPLVQRKARLEALLADRKIAGRRIRYVEHFTADGAAMLASAEELGLEGIVSKKASSLYRPGRSETWTKTKCRAGHEIVLGGWTDTGGRFRSLLGGVFRDGRFIYSGRIGTGFSSAKIETLRPKLAAHARKTSPFDPNSAPPRDKAIHWLDPVLVAEVEFAGWSADGILRQAAFKGLREDKPAASVEAARPARPSSTTVTELRTPKGGGSTGRGKARVEVMGVAISKPEKALWPDAGDARPVTKQDLAAYYEAVGSWMIPHIAGRPCSVVRAPDGIAGQQFFQRHAMAGGSELIGAIRVSGDRDSYLVVETVEALVAVAQSGGLELHPGNGVPDRPDEPGRFVFDLDPAPDVAFAAVVAAARELRTRLSTIGLEGFCKTTGGKGLHVVVPLDARGVDWTAAKAFAREVCLAMERDAPSRFLTKASKSARAGRIFLDYLRNDRLSTAVAPLSPRARDHAPVSMPLTWAQVKADLDPLRFTVRTVPVLLGKSKAWADYARASAPLAAAIESLGRV